MNEIINKEIAGKLMQIEGKAKGSVFINDMDYVLKKEGEEAIERIEEAAKELGYDISLDKFNAEKWYPIGLRVILLLLIKKTLNWEDFEIRKMGKEAVESSLVLKLSIKLLRSLKKFVKEAPSYWKRYYTIGKLKLVSINEKEGSGIFRLEDFKVHPILCGVYLEGLFEKLYQLIMGERGRCKHTKCVFKDSPYCEYTSWIEEKPKIFT